MKIRYKNYEIETTNDNEIKTVLDFILKDKVAQKPFFPTRLTESFVPNAGKSWLDSEVRKLKRMLKNGEHVSKIAMTLGRTEHAVRCKISNLRYTGK